MSNPRYNKQTAPKRDGNGRTVKPNTTTGGGGTTGVGSYDRSGPGVPTPGGRGSSAKATIGRKEFLQNFRRRNGI